MAETKRNESCICISFFSSSVYLAPLDLWCSALATSGLSAADSMYPCAQHAQGHQGSLNRHTTPISLARTQFVYAKHLTAIKAIRTLIIFYLFRWRIICVVCEQMTRTARYKRIGRYRPCRRCCCICPFFSSALGNDQRKHTPGQRVCSAWM